jgi:hypothetical protein
MRLPSRMMVSVTVSPGCARFSNKFRSICEVTSLPSIAITTSPPTRNSCRPRIVFEPPRIPASAAGPAGVTFSIGAQRRAADAAVLDQVLRNAARGVDRNREADAGSGSAGREDRAVDADYLAVRIEQRAAGISAVDGGIGLNGFVDESGVAGLHGAAERADDASGECAGETEGIADSEGALAHDEIARVAQRERREVVALGIDLNQSDVVALIGADEFRGFARLIAEGDFDLLRVFDDVIVREDVAVLVDQEAGTGAFDGHGIVEEVVLNGARDDVRDGRRSIAVDANVFVFGGVEASLRAHGWKMHGVHRCWRRVRTEVRTGPIRGEADDQSDAEQAQRTAGVRGA